MSLERKLVLKSFAYDASVSLKLDHVNESIASTDTILLEMSDPVIWDMLTPLGPNVIDPSIG